MTTEQSIRKFAQKQYLKALYRHYQEYPDIAKHLKNNNQYYSNFIEFLMYDFAGIKAGKMIKMDKAVTENFEDTFIDELFKIESKELINKFMIECKRYDAITHKINQSNIMELWKKLGSVLDYSNHILNSELQQEIISNFHELYGVKSYQGVNFLIKTDQIAFRLYLLDKKPINLQYYRTYLYRCKLHKNGLYQPDIEKTKLEFHKFNVWLDGFYKKNKLNNHRLEDEEKQFYLYLLKEANDVCKVFPSYFSNEVNIKWWGEDRWKSLKQSKAWLKKQGKK